MLGDSVRRRSKPAPAAGRQPPRRVRILPAWSWKRWTAVLGVAAAVPFLAGYLVATQILFPAQPEAAGGIPVPDLVGRTDADAAGALAAAGLTGAQALRLPHPTEPVGTVIAQSPLPGQQLRTGAGVSTAVSSGVPRAVVPDVVGFSEGRAAALLRRMGFEVAREMGPADEPAGHVIGSDPPAGRDLALPARITIRISSGPPPVDTTDARWPQLP